MKLTKEEQSICKKYSKRDENGKVHCPECPLVFNKRYCICKCNASKTELKEYGMEQEQWYYFTFGKGQKHEGHYVKFYGTYFSTREKMVEKYGNEWAFQYTQQWWEALEKDKDDLPYPLETELQEDQ